MTDYGYKVRLVNEECGTQRFVTFHDDRFLSYHEAADEAPKHISSQTCHRCGINHPDDTYVAVDIERGEPDYYGALVWRNAYTSSRDTAEQQELFA